ncbi:FAD-dependent monooxygenase [Rathayibacter sp. Leaf299]|uniref:FAD-dependent oxidoreductase n=1 Tax=Rathayibacter sp. Leaf299 TaxID=1736328 RepID=UPI0012F9797D
MQPTSSAQREPRRTAVIVKASLSGLMTALTLARAGVRVTLLERSDDSGRTGASIGIENGLLERVTGLSSDQIPQPLAPACRPGSPPTRCCAPASTPTRSSPSARTPASPESTRTRTPPGR